MENFPTQSDVDAVLSSLNETALQNGLLPLPSKPTGLKHPNLPCSHCGLPDARQKCGACLATFYCSRVCQKADWKLHKKLCPLIKSEHTEWANEEGDIVVECMLDDNLDPIRRVENVESCDNTAIYNAAVKEGLFDALKHLFSEDSKASEQEGSLVDRFNSKRGKDLVVYSQWIVPTLWRANRSAADTGMFKMSKSRVLGYVRSSPEAWDSWFDAACVTALLPTAVNSRRYDGSVKALAHRAARDVWACFAGVFCDPVIAKGILSTPEVVTNIFGKLKKLLLELNEQDNIGADPQSVVVANANQTAAMIRHWCVTFPYLKPASKDIEKQLGLKSGTRLVMFNRVARPIAEGIIKRGRNLTPEETNVVLMGSMM